ncbi:hypothetical protein FNYG_14610 [Fusarium nygamai]|uniref:Heterokaryon incompatibility domain-containing protein n=1 Tax=Gibberella nygamai TaxID=42673 RepID=A0A2K0USA4_GIBNY|nr:hypothetical protein FNYG_14610 [Fusarium nygamai]
MQRDIDFTIGDIVENLHDPPLSSFAQQNVPRATYSNLRFLKIPSLNNNRNLISGVTCELTERGAHSGEVNYVAVSYCWSSSNSTSLDTGDDSSQPSPTVQVNQNGTVRPPKCAAEVLIRAIMFAISKNVSLIWIDQECVDQNDETDIQNHLRCNHIIYHQARFKIGLLNFELTSKRQIDCLGGIQLVHRLTDSRIYRGWGVRSILKDIQFLTRLVRAISRDRWFTRAWVFQERYSANIDMCLLLPVAGEILESFTPGFGIDLIGGDFAMVIGEVCTVAVVWRQHLSDPGLNAQLRNNTSINASLPEALNSLHDTVQFLSGPIFAGTPLNIVWDTFPSGAGRPRDINSVRNFPIQRAFEEIESCDCQVVSDRVAILSNLMGFEWRFPTTSFKSYSFALVSLLVANAYFPAVLVRTSNPRPPDLFSRSLTVMDLIVRANNLKTLSADTSALQLELSYISRALCEEVVSEDETLSVSIKDAIQHLVEGPYSDNYDNLPESFLTLEMTNVRSANIVPLSLTIGEILKGVVGVNHVDNVGLGHTHGAIVIGYGIQTNQLRAGDIFMAFDGAYRWRSGCIENSFSW